MSQPSARPLLYKGYRFPPEIIGHGVWLYYRFSVSLRDVSELMLARGLWTLRFGLEYARRLRRTRGACSNTWHLDELCLMINGERGWLWRAVDDAGEVLDILVQRHRSARGAKRFFRKLLKGLRMVPAAIVTAPGELRGGEGGRVADCLTSSPLAPEQPHRELAPTGPPA
jgi:putative transposase